MEFLVGFLNKTHRLLNKLMKIKAKLVRIRKNKEKIKTKIECNFSIILFLIMINKIPKNNGYYMLI